MMWIITLIKFIGVIVGVFTACQFVISCIMLNIAPEIVTDKNGKAYEKYEGTRLWLAIIMGIAWAVVITL